MLGLLGLLTLPAAVEVAARSNRIGLLDAGYAIPLALLLGLVALVMARRARRNLRWIQLREGGTGYRIYAGFSGWAPRQLEGELERDGWYVVAASEES